jgi:hypothetical protein
MGKGGNPYHDKRGRFTTAAGAYTRTGENAPEYGRGKQRHPLVARVEYGDLDPNTGAYGLLQGSARNRVAKTYDANGNETGWLTASLGFDCKTLNVIQVQKTGVTDQAYLFKPRRAHNDSPTLEPGISLLSAAARMVKEAGGSKMQVQGAVAEARAFYELTGGELVGGFDGEFLVKYSADAVRKLANRNIPTEGFKRQGSR